MLRPPSTLLHVCEQAAAMSAEAQAALRPPPVVGPTPHSDQILEAGARNPLAVRGEARGAAPPRHSSAAERGEQWTAVAARAAARSGGGEAAGGGAAGGGAGGGAGGEARLSRQLQSRVAELDAEVAALRHEAEAKAVGVGAAHRRELLEAQRWGSALEAQLGLAQAAPSTRHDVT